MKTEAEGYANQGTLGFMRCHQKVGEMHGMTLAPSEPPEGTSPA